MCIEKEIPYWLAWYGVNKCYIKTRTLIKAILKCGGYKYYWENKSDYKNTRRLQPTYQFTCVWFKWSPTHKDDKLSYYMGPSFLLITLFYDMFKACVTTMIWFWLLVGACTFYFFITNIYSTYHHSYRKQMSNQSKTCLTDELIILLLHWKNCTYCEALIQFSPCPSSELTWRQDMVYYKHK